MKEFVTAITLVSSFFETVSIGLPTVIMRMITVRVRVSAHHPCSWWCHGIPLVHSQHHFATILMTWIRPNVYLYHARRSVNNANATYIHAPARRCHSAPPTHPLLVTSRSFSTAQCTAQTVNRNLGHITKKDGARWSAYSILCHIEIVKARPCVTYLQLENESESNSVIGNFKASRIGMHRWPTGEISIFMVIRNTVPDHFQNLVYTSPAYSPHSSHISWKSARNFLSYPANRQTNILTDKLRWKQLLPPPTTAEVKCMYWFQ